MTIRAHAMHACADTVYALYTLIRHICARAVWSQEKGSRRLQGSAIEMPICLAWAECRVKMVVLCYIVYEIWQVVGPL